ncbi:hypothetical protein [Desulfofundulus thermosubterraneus]|uniref:Uncharacterized protein n=1 Tax=Desulfofundulus thermosubterraneus DSM 16057 TaxID=1121432 RepID=A0A1M6F1F9_9FIRM|nr:hypothetical protein [Desulfofundulus thermosubterraneus]SHI91505.1 hypothetical protein SAMN02745219_01361 [Desulfofundulus thermosubterraneus DSM 16057]
MGWYPKKVKPSKKRTTSHSQNRNSSHLIKITSWLTARISVAESRDPELRRLKHLLTSLSETRAKVDVRPVSLAEIERQWKFDRLQGRATSYYTLEEQVLTADLPYVLTMHNREVVTGQIESRRRELAWEVARDFWPLWSLDGDERRAVLALAGVREPSPHAGPQPLPLEAAAQYAVRVRGSRRAEDDWEPDPEVLEVMEGWRGWFSEGDLHRMAVAEAGAGGKLEKGRKLMVIYGSSGRNYQKGDTHEPLFHDSHSQP